MKSKKSYLCNTPRTDMLYLAYGSNLNRAQMLDRCPTSVPVRRVAMRNWTLVFRGVADIERRERSVVEGALYRVTSADVASLDRYEGVRSGKYEPVTIRLPETDDTAFFYVQTRKVAPHRPTEDYFSVVMDGFADWNIPLRTLTAALKGASDAEEALQQYEPHCSAFEGDQAILA